MTTGAGPLVTGWRVHLPNALTCVRVVFACVLFALLSVWRYDRSPMSTNAGVDWLLLGAAGLFIAAAITDALDGHLARRWGVVSVFGRIMDPFADKILVIGTFAFMASASFWSSVDRVQVSGVHAWMVALVLARELLVTSIRGAMEGMGVSFAASWSGKWKMILQSAVLPLVLVLLASVPVVRENPGTGRSWAGLVIDASVWLTVAVTAWSGAPYVSRALEAARSLSARREERGS